MGVGLTLLALAPSTHAYTQFAAVLALVGFWGGLVAVPFYALLQQRAGAQEKGHLMATNNFVNMGGVLAASGCLWLLREVFHIPADGILPIASISTLAVTVAALRALPEFPLRAALWMLAYVLYRARVVGRDLFPRQGPVLLVCDQPTLLGGLLVCACAPRAICPVVDRQHYERAGLGWALRRMTAIPVGRGKPRELARALARAETVLRGGQAVCLFARAPAGRDDGARRCRSTCAAMAEAAGATVLHVGCGTGRGDGDAGGHRRPWLPRPVTVTFAEPRPEPCHA